ncbi:MAG: virulence factor MviN [Micrococcales bacterium]|nr:MAG: virulence factor MviN [Micrococcales bacterium]PIE26687.1 MAG: virulence factor MviN [Micrococcales bacterium]
MGPELNRAAPTLAAAAASIAVLTVVARVTGFGRWVVQSATLGRGCVAQVYAAANQLPNVVYEVAVGGALVAAVVPAIAPMVGSSGGSTAGQPRGQVRDTVGALLTWVLLLTVPAAGLLWASAPRLAGPLTPDQCPGADPLAEFFIAVFAVQIVLYGLGVVAIGVVQAHHRFVLAALAPSLSSVVVILTYLLTGRLAGGMIDDPARFPAPARWWLAWGTTAGVAALSLPVLVLMIRGVGVRPRLTLRFPAGIGARIRAQALGGLAALLAQQLSVVTILVLSGLPSAPVGALALWQYTQAVFLLPVAVLAQPIVTAAFPRLAAATSDFAAQCARTQRSVLAAGLLGGSVLVAVALPAQSFFADLDASGRGAGGMAAALVALAGAVPATAGLTHATRALQAADRPRAAAYCAATGWGLVSLVAVLLAGVFGSSRILLWAGLGTTAGMAAGWVLAVMMLRRHTGVDGTRGVVRVLGAGGAGAVTAAVAGAVAGILVMGQPVPVPAAGTAVAAPGVGWLRAAGAAACAAVIAGGVTAAVLARVEPALWATVRRIVRRTGVPGVR